MTPILEAVFQFLGEMLLEVVCQCLAELGARGLAELLRGGPSRNPVLIFSGYGFLGALLGGLSKLIRSTLFIHQHELQILNLIVTPVFVAAGVSFVYKLKGGQILVPGWQRFLNAWAFATMFGLLRYLVTR